MVIWLLNAKQMDLSLVQSAEQKKVADIQAVPSQNSENLQDGGVLQYALLLRLLVCYGNGEYLSESQSHVGAHLLS